MKKGSFMYVNIKSQKGQATVEMVLLLALMVAMSYLVLEFFKGDDRRNQPVYNFISGPWKTIGGMIESGSWAKRSDAMPDHPNYWRRMHSREGM